MGFNSEFRSPTRWYSKLAIAFLAVAFFAILAASAVSGYLLSRILRPIAHAQGTLADLPGHPERMSYQDPIKGPRTAWFFPGLKSAPSVVLSSGYRWSGGELLTLASALQDHQYNVLVVDFLADGTERVRTTLGFEEVAELRAAMDALARRGDVDAERFGLWGVDLGAYVALAVGTTDRRVQAIVLESVYDHPRQLLQLLLKEAGAGSLPLIGRITTLGFRWLQYSYRDVPPLAQGLDALGGTPQQYLESPETPELSATTREIFRLSPPPHELVHLPRGNYAGMSDEEKRRYENRVVSFFLINLPIEAPAARR